MEKNDILNKMSRVGYLIGELEERINNNFLSTKHYQTNARRMKTLYEYKEHLRREYNNFGKAPNEDKRDEEGIISRLHNGKIEYHTSYGWFTDEQVRNLQKSRYFNE